MQDVLKKIIAKLDGIVIAVTVDDEVKKILSSNKKITDLYTLEKSKILGNLKHEKKSIKLRKIKKKFKNKADYILVDVNGVNIDLNKIINNTYRLSKKKIIFYGIYDEYDVDRLAMKYSRYNAKCDKKMYGNSFILEVDVKNIKLKNRFIDIIKDFFMDIIDIIGNLLLS